MLLLLLKSQGKSCWCSRAMSQPVKLLSYNSCRLHTAQTFPSSSSSISLKVTNSSTHTPFYLSLLTISLSPLNQQQQPATQPSCQVVGCLLEVSLKTSNPFPLTRSLSPSHSHIYTLSPKWGIYNLVVTAVLSRVLYYKRKQEELENSLTCFLPLLSS